MVGAVGNDVGGGGDVLSALDRANADVVVSEGSNQKLAGIVESYKPKWSAQIQQACNADTCFRESIKAALLIVRHPRSGTVYTYVMKNNTIPVNAKMKTMAGTKVILKSYLNTANFKPEQIDFCVNPMGGVKYDSRANVRINAGARNSSAVEVINDEGNNKCK